MRSMSFSWTKRVKGLNKPQDKLPNDLISRSGRIRKVKDVYENHFDTSIVQSNKVTTMTTTTTNLEDSDKTESESVMIEAGVEPMKTVEETPNREIAKDNKSRVNVDLLQKVLGESVEEWFSLSEVIKSNKGKPYKKRKIVLPPMNESDFCFELAQNKDTVKKPEGEDKRINSTSDKEPGARNAEKSKKGNAALQNNANDKVNNTVIDKECEMTIESTSFLTVDEDFKEEEDKRVEKKDTEMIEESSKKDEVSENGQEKTTENGKNKRFRHFFALILYGDETIGKTESQMMAADSEEKISNHQAKTVIKTLNLETADLKEFEVELGDFCKLPKDSPIFECVNGIEKLLQTGAAGSTLRKSLSAECLNVFPKSDSEKTKESVEIPATLPSGQRKMNLKARECLLVLRNDIVEKYKRKAQGRVNQEVQKLNENENEKVNVEEKRKERSEKAKEFRKKDSKEMTVDKAEHKKKPKTNKNVHENREKEEINGSVDEKVETGLEMKVVTNTSLTQRTKLMMKKRMDNKKANKMSAMRIKKRKQLGQARTREKLDKLFSYINTMKRKSGYKSSSESADSLNLSNEDSTPKQFESNQETRVDKTELKQETDAEGKLKRRKSQREIRLTPKLVHMIATSHKRTRRSPSIREDSMEDTDYEYPNLIKKVVSRTVTPEVVESPSSASANENSAQLKIDANASDLECSWQPGDLVWARFAGSPFWPSLVLRDPFDNDEYTKVKHLGRLLKQFVHLQFLADAGRRAWVPEIYCMRFNGLNEFEKIKSNLPELNAFAKRSDLVYQKAFFPSKEQAWSEAVKEGETLLNKSKDDRITYMKIKYPLVKYTESVTNEQLMTNGTTSHESHSVNRTYSTRKRKTISSSSMEVLNRPNCEKVTTSEEPSNKTNESFECAKPADVEENKKEDEKESPKLTLKLVRSPNKEESKVWSKSLDGVEAQLAKKPKKNVQVSQDKMSNSGITLRSHKKAGGKKEEVCEVCLRMLGRRNIIKCNGVCTGVIPRGSRKKIRVKVASSEEGATSALKKRKRRRKFSSPRVSRWKEKLRSIFDFYKDYGGCKSEGMDVRGLVSLYRSLCNSRTVNRRQSAK